MPQEFGATLWGRAWVRMIESTAAAPNPLLPKARSLARNHAASLVVGAGRIDAEVITPGAVHRVRITVPPWTEAVQEDVSRLVGAAVTAGPALAAGDLPDSLEADFNRHGIGIAVRPGEEVSTCSCRTRRRPCVHVLATVYSLAQLVDERPALCVELRSTGVTTGAATVASSPEWTQVVDLAVAGFYGN